MAFENSWLSYYLHDAFFRIIFNYGARWRSRYSDLLRAGPSGARSLVGATFSAPVQTGPEAHPASCTTGAESLSRG
jgi:hypothetical protein